MRQIVCDLCGVAIQGRFAENFMQTGAIADIDAEIDLGHVVIRYSCTHRNDEGKIKSRADICPSCIRRAFGAEVKAE